MVEARVKNKMISQVTLVLTEDEAKWLKKLLHDLVAPDGLFGITDRNMMKKFITDYTLS